MCLPVLVVPLGSELLGLAILGQRLQLERELVGSQPLGEGARRPPHGLRGGRLVGGEDEVDVLRRVPFTDGDLGVEALGAIPKVGPAARRPRALGVKAHATEGCVACLDVGGGEGETWELSTASHALRGAGGGGL